MDVSSSPSETQNKNKEKNINSHRRAESDVKISNPFLRGFRRENSDFFPLSSTRHSAIFVDRNINPLRSSGFFNNRRGSDINISGLTNNINGEPILTDFVQKNVDNTITSKNDPTTKSKFQDKKFDFLKPRREKTESDIVLRNSASRQGLRNNLELRRFEIENKYSQETNNFRRRSSKPLNNSITDDKLPLDGGEYLYLQVTYFISFSY